LFDFENQTSKCIESFYNNQIAACFDVNAYAGTNRCWKFH